MERAILTIKTPKKSPRQHTITHHTGCYWAPSKNYSRKKCLDTMLALDPEVRIIYIRLNGGNYELAKRSGRGLAKGKMIFHFNANWKIESVETSMPHQRPTLGKRHQHVEKEG